MILPAENGTIEDLEKELGLSFSIHKDRDIAQYFEITEDLPKTLLGLIKRLAEDDFTDSDLGSLTLAFELYQLRLTPQKSTRHSERFVEQANKQETRDDDKAQPQNSDRELVLKKGLQAVESSTKTEKITNIEEPRLKRRKVDERESSGDESSATSPYV